MKAATRQQLADAAGVSRQTFSRWLQNDRQTLEQLGVKKRSKALPPSAVEYICRKYCIEFTNR